MISKLDEREQISDQDTWYGKMLREHSAATKEQTFDRSYKKSSESSAKNAPVLPQADKWNHAGIIYDDMGRWSIAWRLHDAQYWGVPQRRRRIALVADFGGLTAGEILFKPESLSGNTEQSGTAKQDITRTADESVGQTGGDICVNTSCGDFVNVREDGMSGPLLAEGHQPCVIDKKPTAYSFDALASNSMKSKNPHSGCREVDISKTLDCFDPNPSKNQGGVAILQDDDVYCLQGNGIDRANTAGCNGKGWRKDKSYTLNTIDRPAVYDARGNGDGDTAPTMTGDHNNRITDYTAICVQDKVCYKAVRRLTPLECERLQGYPTVREVKFSEMTKDEYIAWNISEKHIIVDTNTGIVYETRGPGGIQLSQPQELKGSIVNGYRVISIRNGDTKMQCRVNRIVWIAKHGIIPDGYVVDHINNNKLDNRIDNLQLLTAAENSKKQETMDSTKSTRRLDKQKSLMKYMI